MTTPKKRGRPRKIAPAPVEAPKPKQLYKITLDFGTEVKQAEGTSVQDMFSKITRPVKIVGKTFLVVSKGEHVYSTTYNPIVARRMFYPMVQKLFCKNIELLLK